MRIDISIDMFGTMFSPAKLGQKTGVPVKNANEVGDIGKIGKYRGKPRPYGAGEWCFSSGEGKPYGPIFEKAIRMLETYKEEILACGAEDIVLHFQVYYEAQCNLEFSPSKLNRLSALAIPFTISCEQLIPDGEEK